MFSRHRHLLRSFKRMAALSVFLLGAGRASALGLGELVVHSRLGQPLRAEIRLIEPPGATNPGETCFRLGEASGREDLPVLTQGRLKLEQVGGQNRLVVTSLQTINEPALLLQVRVGCGAELVRSYTVLIDPVESEVVAPPIAETRRANRSDSERAVVQAASAPPTTDAYPTAWEVVEGESGQSITRALFPRQPRAQRRFLNALREANPDIDFGDAGGRPLAAGATLSIPDTRRAPIASKSAAPVDTPPAPVLAKKTTAAVKPATEGKLLDRLMISGDAASVTEADGAGDGPDPGLRLSSALSIQLSDQTSENARAMLRVEYKLMNALVFQAEKQLELAEQLRNLEARFAELRAVTDGATKAAESGQAATPEVTSVKEKAVETTEVVVSPKPRKAIAPAVAPPVGSDSWWPEILLLLAIAGGVAVWLIRRQRARQGAATSLPESAPESAHASTMRSILAGGTPSESVDPWDAAEAEARVAAKAPAFQPDILLDASQPLPFQTDERAKTVPPALAIEVNHVEEADDSSTVLELAEIMVSFGRIKGAAQALAEYIESNPDVSLLPWLKLLEIYRTNDMQEEFVACSARLRSHFNVAPATWEEAGACLGEKIEPLSENDLSIEDMLQKLPTVATFPHIREGIAKTWDTSEGLAYLKHLLRDTRNGQRTGFPLSIARELLFLLDLLDTRLRNKT